MGCASSKPRRHKPHTAEEALGAVADEVTFEVDGKVCLRCILLFALRTASPFSCSLRDWGVQFSFLAMPQHLFAISHRRSPYEQS